MQADFDETLGGVTPQAFKNEFLLAQANYQTALNALESSLNDISDEEFKKREDNCDF